MNTLFSIPVLVTPSQLSSVRSRGSLDLHVAAVKELFPAPRCIYIKHCIIRTLRIHSVFSSSLDESDDLFRDDLSKWHVPQL